MADETQTKRNQYVHKPAIALLPAISMKTRYIKKIQGVPPLPDGSVCRFAAIVDELCPSGLAALFMYQHPAIHEYRKAGNVFVLHAIASGTPLTSTHTDRT